MLDEEDKRKVARELGNGVGAQNSVPTAIYCFAKNYKRYAKAISYAVSLGGNTDTIAAMTGAIAGALQGLENSSAALREKLEKRDRIEALAKELWQVKNSPIRLC